MIPRVFVASPYAAETKQGVADNVAFARAALFDSLRRGEAGYAPHLLYPHVLDDGCMNDRERGIACGLAYLHVCSLVAAYVDRGVSRGMRVELRQALLTRTPIEFRRLDGRAPPTPRWLHANSVPHEECPLCLEEVTVLAEPILPTATPYRPNQLTKNDLPTVPAMPASRICEARSPYTSLRCQRPLGHIGDHEVYSERVRNMPAHSWPGRR